MEKPTGLVSIDWPAPNPDGTTTLTPVQVSELGYFLGQLHDYIQAQLAKCGAHAP